MSDDFHSRLVDAVAQALAGNRDWYVPVPRAVGLAEAVVAALGLEQIGERNARTGGLHRAPAVGYPECYLATIRRDYEPVFRVRVLEGEKETKT